MCSQKCLPCRRYEVKDVKDVNFMKQNRTFLTDVEVVLIALKMKLGWS